MLLFLGFQVVLWPYKWPSHITPEPMNPYRSVVVISMSRIVITWSLTAPVPTIVSLSLPVIIAVIIVGQALIAGLTIIEHLSAPVDLPSFTEQRFVELVPVDLAM